jgi:hypothetical protein
VGRRRWSLVVRPSDSSRDPASICCAPQHAPHLGLVWQAGFKVDFCVFFPRKPILSETLQWTFGSLVLVGPKPNNPQKSRRVEVDWKRLHYLAFFTRLKNCTAVHQCWLVSSQKKEKKTLVGFLSGTQRALQHKDTKCSRLQSGWLIFFRLAIMYENWYSSTWYCNNHSCAFQFPWSNIPRGQSCSVISNMPCANLILVVDRF